MAKNRKLLTNFSKGELSPKVEGRPDLVAYFEGGKIIENFVIMRQGGLDRRVGTRFVAEVKDSTRDVILIPFEASVDDAFIIEVGHLYMRFFKNGLPILVSAGGPPLEVVSPYTEAQIRTIHFTQSVDVLFLFHPDVPQYKLSRLSDLNWVLGAINFRPPPSFEADTDISGGVATLTPAAVTGENILFTASSAVFLAGDKNRLVIFGASRATIRVVDSSTTIHVDILDNFPNTSPIQPGQWFLRLSPQTTLDPLIKAPVGAICEFIAGVAAFRLADHGKFIVVYGGVSKITAFDSSTKVQAEIMSEMTGTTFADPPVASAGAWTLEENSWVPKYGFARTGEFIQGRLVQASTYEQPTTFWMSAVDDFENYAIGIEADRAIEYTVASRKLNRIEWVGDHSSMFLGTSGAELQASAGKTDEPFGGDIVPKIDKMSAEGSAPIQPIFLNKRLLFIDRSRKKIFTVSFNLEEDSFNAVEVTGVADHILLSSVVTP